MTPNESEHRKHKQHLLRLYHKALTELHEAVKKWDDTPDDDQKGWMLTSIGFKCSACDRAKYEFERIRDMSTESWVKEQEATRELFEGAFG